MADDIQSEREFNERNIAEFRRNGGKVGGPFDGFPLLIMTTTGAKSGVQREKLVGYFDIDDRIYVVGSAAGRDSSPAWVFNLRAHPDITVEVGTTSSSCPTRSCPTTSAYRTVRVGKSSIAATSAVWSPSCARC